MSVFKPGLIIFITGCPGSGKSTLAIQLANFLHIDSILQTDLLKEIWKTGNTSLLACDCSHNVWKLLGRPTRSNLIKGYELHTGEYQDVLLRVISAHQLEGKSLIIEGVQAAPKIYSSVPGKNKLGLYLPLLPKRQHFARFDAKNSYRTVKNTSWYSHYKYMKIIDNYALTQAKKYGLHIIYGQAADSLVPSVLACLSQP